MPYVLRKYRDANYKVLKPVHPNVGVAHAYRKRLEALIRQMHDDVLATVRRAYTEERPVMAQDASPATMLNNVMRQLANRWLANFDMLADRFAAYFAHDVADRSDAALQRALRQSGFAVNFVITPAMRDVLQSIIHENVALIRSIPQQYLNQVEGMVMRSVQHGRDLGTLSRGVQDQFGVTTRRAALIARDQNNKATGALQRVRQKELGIKQAIWMHSHAGKEPRPTHVQMDGKKYDVDKGMYDSAEGRRIFPGELINCRCTSRSVVPGFA